MNQVEELETAILNRAERLATEVRERAERQRDRILADANEQLRLREEREVLLAKAASERNFRRKVQADELKLQSHMDHLRWNLVRGVEQRLNERLKDFVQDEEEYFGVLRAYLAEGVKVLGDRMLVAELNAPDLARLETRWNEFVDQACPGAEVTLAKEPRDCLGGVLVRDEANRVRLDNTFEGRRDRLRAQLNQVIVERLLPAGLG